MTLTKQIIEERIGELIGHYSCEDSWYSCPLAEGGSADKNAGEKCNCGRPERIILFSTLFIQMCEELIPKKNDALPSNQSWYEDTPSDVINSLGRSDGRHEVIDEMRAELEKIKGK